MYKFNTDFEHYLFNTNYNPVTPKYQFLNQEFEYLFFFLERDELYSEKFYSTEYRNYVELISGNKVQINKKGVNPRGYWGDTTHDELQKKLNDKIFFVQALEHLNLNQQNSKIIKNIEDISFFPCLVKQPHDFSGQQIFSIKDQQDLKDKTKLLIKMLAQSELILEPFIDSRKDIGVQVKPDGSFVTYENSVDDKFQYKGSIISEGDHLNESQLAKVKKIIDYYKEHGANNYWSIDLFLYKNKLHFCEVNHRKTMGTMSLKLRDKYFENNNYFIFKLYPQRKMKFFKDFNQLQLSIKKIDEEILLLSPLGNRFLTLCFGTNDETLIVEKVIELEKLIFDDFISI